MIDKVAELSAGDCCSSETSIYENLKTKTMVAKKKKRKQCVADSTIAGLQFILDSTAVCK